MLNGLCCSVEFGNSALRAEVESFLQAAIFLHSPASPLNPVYLIEIIAAFRDGAVWYGIATTTAGMIRWQINPAGIIYEDIEPTSGPIDPLLLKPEPIAPNKKTL